jgi:hypothetical protein
MPEYVGYIVTVISLLTLFPVGLTLRGSAPAALVLAARTGQKAFDRWILLVQLLPLLVLLILIGFTFLLWGTERIQHIAHLAILEGLLVIVLDGWLAIGLALQAKQKLPWLVLAGSLLTLALAVYLGSYSIFTPLFSSGGFAFALLAGILLLGESYFFWTALIRRVKGLPPLQIDIRLRLR